MSNDAIDSVPEDRHLKCYRSSHVVRNRANVLYLFLQSRDASTMKDRDYDACISLPTFAAASSPTPTRRKRRTFDALRETSPTFVPREGR